MQGLLAVQARSYAYRVFSLRRPSDAHVQQLLARQREAAVTYEPVGGLLAGEDFALPSRCAKRPIGPAAVFDAAREILQHWGQYSLDWTHIAEPKPPIAVGEVVAILARTAGVWSVNCSRIVNVVDDSDRFGYSMGTLPHHVESGEELFLLTRIGGQCVLEIRSASGPNHPLVRLGWWYAKRTLRRFARDAMERMTYT